MTSWGLTFTLRSSQALDKLHKHVVLLPHSPDKIPTTRGPCAPNAVSVWREFGNAQISHLCSYEILEWKKSQQAVCCNIYILIQSESTVIHHKFLF